MNKHIQIQLTTMTKLAVIFFFVFFTLSHARIQIRKPKYDAIVRQFSNPLPEYDVKATLRLPSESINEDEQFPDEQHLELDGQNAQPNKNHQQSRPVEHLPDLNGPEVLPVENQHQAEEAQPESNTDEAQPGSNEEEAHPVEPETKAAAVEGMLLKQARFRPGTHQIRLSSRLPYRLCRHNHLHHVEEIMPGGSQVQTPFGEGMTLTFAENGDFDQEVFHLRPNRFPVRHHLHHHHHGSFSNVPHKRAKFLHHRHGPHHVHQHEWKVSTHLPEKDHEKPKDSHRRNGDDGEKAEVDWHTNEKNESNFSRRIRKFLGQYFE